MTTAAKQAKIVLVDDHPIVREQLGGVIAREAGLKVCGEAESRHQALEVIAAVAPDLVIIDLSLKDSHGLDLIKDIHVRYPQLRMLVLSMHEGTLHAERAIRAGAHGYITKQEATKKVLLAIRKVLGGETYLDDTVASQIATRMIGTQNKEAAGIDRLTDQELRVLDLIGRGQTMRQIAETLHLNVKTIETYRARIKEKLALDDSTQVLQYAIHWIHGGGTS